MADNDTGRRDILLAAILASLPLALAGQADASPLDPAQTIIRKPDALTWIPNKGYPERSVDMCPLTGSTNEPGLYYTLVRWWPGYMSAPHTYITDRFCVIVSGTWWVNSGPDFDPAATVPVSAGTFIRRVAHTPHYDGVIKGHPEPVIVAICGVGPVDYKAVDPTQPGWRAV